MKNKDLLLKTVSVLANASAHGILNKGICTACAVGCLVANGMKYFIVNIAVYPNIVKDLRWYKSTNNVTPDTKINPQWQHVFYTAEDKKVQYFWRDSYFGKSKEHIDSTGYKLDELARIENAFECFEMIGVFNTLARIHETTLEEVENLYDSAPIIQQSNEFVFKSWN